MRTRRVRGARHHVRRPRSLLGVGTAARGWAAVLLLAAVFLGHGLQCATTGNGATHVGTAVGAGHAVSADDGLSATAVAVGAAHAQPTASVTVHTGTAPATEHDVAPAATTGGTQGHWHGLPGHLLAACLAVLAAGLAILLVLAALGLVRLVLAAARRSCVRGLPWLVPPRPPDLLSLCVLRI